MKSTREIKRDADANPARNTKDEPVTSAPKTEPRDDSATAGQGAAMAQAEEKLKIMKAQGVSQNGGISFVNRGSETVRIQVERRTVGNHWARDAMVDLRQNDQTEFNVDVDHRIIIDQV